MSTTIMLPFANLSLYDSIPKVTAGPKDPELDRLKEAGLDVGPPPKKGKKRWCARRVICTVHERPDWKWDPHKMIRIWKKDKRVRYVRAQREPTKKGGIHWQIYAQFIGQLTSRKAAQKALGIGQSATYIARACPDVANDYCSKSTANEATLQGGKWKGKGVRISEKPEDQCTYGTMSGASTDGEGAVRWDIEALKELIMDGANMYDIAVNHFALWTQYGRMLTKFQAMHLDKTLPDWRPVSAMCLYGETGRGKSQAAVTIANKKYGPCNYFKAIINDQGKWWFSNYQGQKVLIVEEFYGGKCKFSSLQTLLDRYKHQVETKGGEVWAQWELIIITSNQHPKYWWNSYASIPPSVRTSFIRRFAKGGIEQIVRTLEPQEAKEELTWDSITTVSSYTNDGRRRQTTAAEKAEGKAFDIAQASYQKEKAEKHESRQAYEPYESVKTRRTRQTRDQRLKSKVNPFGKLSARMHEVKNRWLPVKGFCGYSS